MQTYYNYDSRIMMMTVISQITQAIAASLMELVPIFAQFCRLKQLGGNENSTELLGLLHTCEHIIAVNCFVYLCCWLW